MTVDLENDEEASSDSGSSKKRKTAADRVLDVDNTSKSQTKKAKFNSAMKPTGSPAVPPSTLVQPTSQDKKKVARKATRRERAAISDSDFDEEEQDVPLTKTTARSKGFVAEKDTEVTHPPARPRRSAANRKSVIDLAGDDDDDEERVKSPPPRPSPRKQRMDDEAAARIVISDLGLDDDEEDAENTPPPVRQSKPQSTKRAPRRAVAMDTDDSDASSSRMTSKSVYRIQDSEDEYVP
ncbi:hypothetical protein DFJ77DRAFT_349296 [Powellomyces hirtus]|nr:hypothetical protein DFJ77DRAFT_349296 [Powellomyces hirtus]